jgi:hypothetical protein
MTPRTRPLLAAAFLCVALAGCSAEPSTTGTPDAAPPANPPKLCGQAPDLAAAKGSANGFNLTAPEVHPIANSAPPALVVSLEAAKAGAISGGSYRVFLLRDGKIVGAGPLDPASNNGDFAAFSPREVTMTKGQPLQDIIREPLTLCGGESWPSLYEKHDQVTVIMITPVPVAKGAAASKDFLIISSPLPSAA